MGRPPGTAIRRAGRSAKATRGRASSLGAGGSFRCAWGTGVVRRSTLTWTAPIADDGGLVHLHVKEGLLWPARGGWGGSLGTTLRPVMVWVVAWPEYGGQGSNRRVPDRGTAAMPLAGRRRSVSHGPWACSTWQWRIGCERRWKALGPAVAGVLRWSCPVSKRFGPTWPRARRHAWARTPGVASSRNLLSPVQLLFTPNFPTKVGPTVNRKVADLLFLYNFYKGCIGFWSMDFA
jgi:hypothetical protein